MSDSQIIADRQRAEAAAEAAEAAAEAVNLDPASLKNLYKSNNDTNAFTDDEKSKLSGIDTNATDDQTASEIKQAYEANENTNAFTDAEKNKLANLNEGQEPTESLTVGFPNDSYKIPAPYNLRLTPGDTEILAEVDAYPTSVNSYNWYLDGILITTTGTPSYTFTGLQNEQEYEISVSVTVNGSRSNVSSSVLSFYDTEGEGDFNALIGDTNINPVLYYDDNTKRTYFCWSSIEGSKVGVNISYYNHVSKSFSDSTLIGVSTGGLDGHHRGVVNIDSLGFIYVLQSTSHNSEFKLYKSDAAHDISSFSLINTLTDGLAYPKLFINSNDVIFIIGRRFFDGLAVYYSNDGGSNFTSNVLLDNGVNNSGAAWWNYNNLLKSKKDQGLHLVINGHYRPNNLSYTEAFYLYSEDGIVWGDLEWYQTNGDSGNSIDISQNTLNRADLQNNYSIFTYGDTQRFGIANTGIVNNNGIPIVVVPEGNSIDENNLIDSQYIYYGDAGEWVKKEIIGLSDISNFYNTEHDFVSGIYHISGARYGFWRSNRVATPAFCSRYLTDDFFSTFREVEYMTINEGLPNRVVASTFNFGENPDFVLSAGSKIESGYADIWFNPVLPALATPVAGGQNPAPNSFMTTNGVNQYLNIGTLGNFGSGLANPFSIEFNIRTVETDVFDVLGTSDQPAETFLFIRVNQNSELNSENGAIMALLKDDDNSYAFISANGANINDGNFHRVSIVWDGQIFSIYVDGVAQGTNQRYGEAGVIISPPPYPDNFVDFVRFMVVGARNNQGTINNYGDFDINDLRFWQEELTQSKIDTYKNAELVVGEHANLFRYYKLLDATGDTAQEEVASDNGTLVGNVGDNMWGS